MSSNNRYRNNQGYNNSRGGHSKPQQTNYVRRPASSTATQTLSDSLRQPSSSRSGGVPEVGGRRDGSFVIYLPQDEAAATGLTGGLDSVESQRVVDLLNRELSSLLRLKPGEFWKEVSTDTSLHTFLESFLKYRNRWYDFPHRKGVATGGISGESELCRRVFMVLYRISSYASPDAKVLQEKKLLDLPKLLDICALFGRENEDVTRSLVQNAMKAQPWLHKEFAEVSKHFLNIVHTKYQRCTSSSESTENLQDYLEVMDFINDGVVNLDAFVAAYNPAAVFFCSSVERSNGNEELLATLGKLHDIFLPSLQRDLERSRMSNDFVSDVFTSIRLLSGRIIKLGGKLLNLCYLGEEAFQAACPYPKHMFPANMGEPRIRADALVQKLRAISQQYSGFLQNIEKDHHIIGRAEFLHNKGWFSVDDKQKQLLCDILGAKADKQVNEEISQIRDLFPDYGKGFLSACLEVYNHSPEEVIQRILEGTLREDLQRMDTWLEQMPSAKASSSAGISIHEPRASAAGRFTRKAALDEEKLDAKDEAFLSKNSALIKQMGYEDEYDDSFDELGPGVGESGDSDEASHGGSAPFKWPSKKTQFYVKDGKNYSYKVPGAIPVKSCEQAALVHQAQADSIHGLGRDGNAGRRLTEPPRERVAEPAAAAAGRGGNLRGRGRGRGRGNAEPEEGGGRGQGRHDRKNQAAKKHNYGM